MSLDKLIAEAAKSGGLTALTLWPSGKGWQCNVRRKRGNAEGWACVTSTDPVVGLTKALGSVPVVYETPTDKTTSSSEGDIFG